MSLVSLLQVIDQFGWRGALIATVLYFVFIYLVFAVVTTLLTKWALPALKIGSTIDSRQLVPGQFRSEVALSLQSIFIFGLYGVVTRFAYHEGVIAIEWSASVTRILIDTLVLFLWNEVHFYLCHRLLHTRWLFVNVHALHHRSVRPTPFSTYSVHWGEATLLGSVMILALLVFPFSIESVMLLPIVSLIFNNIGHSNYQLSAAGHSTSREHSRHHQRVGGNFGFALPIPDEILGTRFKDKRE